MCGPRIADLWPLEKAGPVSFENGTYKREKETDQLLAMKQKFVFNQTMSKNTFVEEICRP
jgi:hypothetical protein